MIEHKLYNPASQPKELLIENFVVRTKVFEKIFDDIKNSPMKYPEQNYIIQGQRGSGKTTLLLRLKYEIENNHELNQWLIPIYFSEETYDITTLSNLWEKILKYLDIVWSTNGIHYDKTSEFVDSNDYEKKCFDYLIQMLNKNKKKIILFFDNFGQLFLDNLKSKEQHRLREILMNCSDIRIIGASAIVMNDLYDYSKPFYDFFRIINLESLDKNEIIELIEKLSKQSGSVIDFKKNKAKIETLRILTGGITRTIILIYEVILADEDGSALKDLETILDRITPLYKHRIEDLPAQQRKIVDVIAKKWDAVSAKEIAEEIREDGKKMPTKIISAQLNQLEKNNVIEKKQTNTKNHFYQLKERFFNIWYLMRLGDRKDKCKVIWLTKFLEMWYDDTMDMQEYVENHIKHLRSGKYDPNSALIISEALVNVKNIDLENLRKVIDATSGILNIEQRENLPDIFPRLREKVFDFFRNNQFQQAITLLESYGEKSPPINHMLGIAYFKNNESHKAFEIANKFSNGTFGEKYLAGSIFKLLKEYERAIETWKNVIEVDNEIYFEIGECYMNLSNYDEAIHYFRKSIEIEDRAYIPLVEVLLMNDRYEEALEVIKKGINEKDIKELNIYLIQTFLFHFREEKQSEIDNLINSSLIEDPNNPELVFISGVNYDFKGENTFALNEYLKAYRMFHKFKNNSIYKIVNTSQIFNKLINDFKNKEKCLEIIRENPDSNNQINLYKSFVLIWDNQINNGVKMLEQCMVENSINEREFQEIENILLLLLSKKQYHLVYNYFLDSEILLKEKFKPIYYCLMTFLKEEYPNEILRMGSELEEPVKEVIAKVEKWAIDYK